jgi:hypothetical protein
VLFSADIKDAHIPYKYYLVTQLRQGAIPLWNPFIGGGFPMLAETNAGVFHPLNIFFLALPISLAFNYFIIFHFFFAGLFMYLFCRSLRIEPIPSLTGSAVFSLGAFFVCHINHINILSAGIWLPLNFLIIERWRLSYRFTRLLLLSPVFAIQFLSGQPQVVLFSMIASTAYFLYRAYITKHKRLRRSLKPFLLWLAVVGFSLCLASIQLIPTYELTQFTKRSSSSLLFASTGSFPPWHFITYVFPNLFGYDLPSRFPTKLFYQDFSPYPVGYWEVACYVGILPLLLTVSAFFGPLKRPATFFRFLLLSSFILMLGMFSPIFSLVAAIPPMNYFRIPARFIYLATFSFAVLTAICFDSLTCDDRSFSINRVLTCSISLFALLFGTLVIFIVQAGQFGLNLISTLTNVFNILYRYWAPAGVKKDPFTKEFSSLFSSHLSSVFNMSNSSVFLPVIFITLSLLLLLLIKFVYVKRQITQFLVLILVLLDLFSYGYYYNVPTRTEVALKEPQIARYFRLDSNAYRIFYSPSIQKRSGQITKLDANCNILWRVRSLLVYSTLIPKRIESYYYYLMYDVLYKGRTELMSYANVKYLVTKENLKMGILKKLDEYEGVSVYQNDQALPRAFIATKVKLSSGPRESLATLRKKDTDTSTLGIVESKKARFLEELQFKGKGSVKILSDGAQKVTLDVRLSDDALLIFNENYYPGWKALIDGRRTAIYRSNYLFQGIVVPAGNHLVEFRFQPTSFKVGSLASGASLIVFFSFYIFAWRISKSTNNIKAIQETIH